MSAGRSKRNRRHFLLSGFESGKKIELSLKIQSLGGEYNEAVEVCNPHNPLFCCTETQPDKEIRIGIEIITVELMSQLSLLVKGFSCRDWGVS